MGELVEQMRYVTNRQFKKDIQMQIGKPKWRETHMKSKTRHVDGEGENPQVEVCS